MPWGTKCDQWSDIKRRSKCTIWQSWRICRPMPAKKKLRPLRISRADVNTHSSLETQSQHCQQLPPDSIGTVCWHRWHRWHRWHHWHHCHCRISASSTVHLPQTTFYTCLAHDVQQSGGISISNLTGWPASGCRSCCLNPHMSHLE